MIWTSYSPHSSRRWQQQQQHSPLFPTIGSRIQKYSLKFTLQNTWLTGHRVLLSYGCTYETSWEDCWAQKTSRYSLLRHKRAQWEYEARSGYWIWIGEYSSYCIMQNAAMVAKKLLVLYVKFRTEKQSGETFCFLNEYLLFSYELLIGPQPTFSERIVIFL